MWPSEIKKDCWRYPTGLSSLKGRILFDSLHGQLSDGMWENSSRMESFWRFYCVDECEGELQICISRQSAIWQYGQSKVLQNRIALLPHKKLLEWFARRIYDIAKYEEKAWPERGFRLEPGNRSISLCFSRTGDCLTGGDVWSIRKALMAYARSL